MDCRVKPGNDGDRPERCCPRYRRGARHELGADRIAVLAQRRHRAVAPGRAVAARGRGGIRHRAHGRRDLDAAQLRMRRQRGGVVDAGKGDVGLRKLPRERVGGGGAEHRLHLRVGVGAALDPRDVGGKRRIGGERRVAEHLRGQHAPFAVALDRDENVDAVGGLEHAVGRDRGVREADAARRLAALVLHQRHRHPVGHGVEHGDRDRGAVAGLVACDQRLEDGLVGVHPGGDVADRDADARRRVGRPGDRGEPGLGLDQHVVGLARGVGAVLAVAGDRADDQPRMRAPQLVEREAELGGRAGLEVLHEHVGPGEHRRQHGLVVIAGEVEHQQFLAAVEPDEIRALAVTTGIRAFTPVLLLEGALRGFASLS